LLGRPLGVVAGGEAVEENPLDLVGPAVAGDPDQLRAVLAVVAADGARLAGGPFGGAPIRRLLVE
jgi:hypothetical protein